MEVAKGKTLADGTYLFTCGACGGNNADCAWCYGGDIKRIAAELKTARGQRYYGLLKSFLKVNGKPMVDAWKAMKARGSVTPVEIAYLSLKYDLNFKATWEWLHETGCLQRDYDDVRRSFKVAEAYEAARQAYPELAASPSSGEPGSGA